MTSSVYANVSEVARDADVTHYMDSMRQRTPSPQITRQRTPSPQITRQRTPSPQITKSSPQMQRSSPQPVRLTAERDTDVQTEAHVQQYDASISEEAADVQMSQPIQSVTVKGPGIPSQMRDVESPGKDLMVYYAPSLKSLLCSRSEM